MIVQCPICNWSGQDFKHIVFANKPSVCLVCPNCGSYERHRFAYWVLRSNIQSQATLHIAPERCLSSWLRDCSEYYITTDLTARGVMIHSDITDLPFRNNSFSLVWASHVLEHIHEDIKAMLEVNRVLLVNGTAIIQVPVYSDETYEDATINSPADRLRHYGQEDHVRRYGRDVSSKLQSVGFAVDTISINDLRKDHVETHRLDYPSTREIFVCTKGGN